MTTILIVLGVIIYLLIGLFVGGLISGALEQLNGHSTDFWYNTFICLIFWPFVIGAIIIAAILVSVAWIVVLIIDFCRNNTSAKKIVKPIRNLWQHGRNLGDWIGRKVE